MPNEVLKQPESQVSESILTDIRINLVKACDLGLSLREAVVFAMVQRLINLNIAPFSDIDENRWWHIDGSTIHELDIGGHVCRHPSTGENHLWALSDAGLIEIEELEHAQGPHLALRLKTNVVIWESAL